MFKTNDFHKEVVTTQYPLTLDLQLFSQDPEPIDPPAEPIDPPSPVTPRITVEEVIAYLGNAKADVLFKIPSVKALVEHARTEEKDKVYKTIESKDNKIKKLEEDLELAQKALKEKENENLSEQEILQRQVQALQTQLQTLTDSIDAERTASAEEKRKATFEAYKQRRLRELAEQGTEYLPDLLGGDTEEEFDKAVNKAITRFEEIKADLLARSPIQPSTPPRPSTPSVTNPPASGTKAISLSDIRDMSHGDYAKNREKILAEARKGNLQ